MKEELLWSVAVGKLLFCVDLPHVGKQRWEQNKLRGVIALGSHSAWGASLWKLPG